MTKIAIVTNMPTPYRVPVFNMLSKSGVELKVFFCTQIEPNRRWTNMVMDFDHVFLHERYYRKRDGFNFVHNNPDIWGEMGRFAPQVVVTTGFNPTHVYAFLWAKYHHAKHIIMSDGTVTSERSLGSLHKAIRRLFFSGSHAFVAASRSGIELYKSYGIPEYSCFLSCLAVDSALFSEQKICCSRPYDLLFVGILHERKMPMFFVQVAEEIRRRRPKTKVLLVGDGPQREEVLDGLRDIKADFLYAGFVQPADLPRFYGMAKVFLFPTRHDPWGLVAGEAMAAGLPVICTPEAGVASELVMDGDTGFVLPPSVSVWVENTLSLLEHDELLNGFSERARSAIRNYSYENAATGLNAAFRYALQV